MIELNKEQNKVVKSESKRILCLAGAGSGKSRCIVERIAYLIEKKNVSPYEISAQTFTRLAAQELVKRLEKRIGPSANKITCGTIHAVSLNFIQRFGELLGMRPDKITVYNTWESDFLLKEVAKELGYHSGYAWTEVKRKDVYMVLNSISSEIMDYDYTEYYKEVDICNAFFARCSENNALTYDSILSAFLILLPQIKDYLNFKHIFVDEVQDNSRIQWDITNELVRLSDASLFVVGDPDQCQPKGTMVLTTKGEKDIKDIDPNIDELKIYDRHGAMIYGDHNRGYSFKKSLRIFTGNLYRIESKNKKTKCTGNHKWLVKWNNDKRTPEWNVVYMMRRGDRFRIGWCQLFNNTKNDINLFHLSQRMRIEKADSIWILKVFNNKKEASLWESIIASNYGIPTIMFEPKRETYYYDQRGIDFVFDSIGNLPYKANRLLNSLNLDITYPFHSKKRSNQKKGGTRIFEIETINMAIMPDGFFRIPQPKEKSRYIEWNVAYIESEKVRNITVYSLDVEKYHTYIADGLCTKNSIYKFRGADPDYLIRNQDKFDIFKLEKNYRSDTYIVYAANDLIQHNKNRLDLEMDPVKDMIVPIEHVPGIDSNILSKTIPLLTKHKTAVLSRNHYLLEKLSSLLDQANIKHEYLGKKTKLAHSEEFRRFHAFLKLIVNPFDNFAFLLIKDILGIDQEEYADIRIEASEKGESHFNIWSNKSDKFVWMITAHIDDFDSTIYWMKDIEFQFDTEPIFDFIYTWIIDNPDGTIDQYLNWLTTYDIQDEIKKEPEKLQLMTVHAAKGLEFPTVIIIGLNEGIFPDKRSIKEDPSVHDERNLAYVAMTRAEDQLILTSRPLKKDLFEIKNPVSRFVKEAMDD